MIISKTCYAPSAMNLSKTSKADRDPLSALLASLGSKVARITRLEAGGDWALTFPARRRLKFVAVIRGNCFFAAPSLPPRQLRGGDIVLIGDTDYIVCSDASVLAQDGEALYRDQGDEVRLGDPDTALIGGGVEFEADSAEFLLHMLPILLFIDGQTLAAETISTILKLLDRESGERRLGSDAVESRLAELLIVEGLRFHIEAGFVGESGWLAAFADSRITRALQQFHAQVDLPWTIERLAKEAGMSRASFSATFSRLMGMAPIAYVRLWRMTLARIDLKAGHAIADVARRLGYSSQSSFGHAYRRTFGVSPGARDGQPNLRPKPSRRARS